jgi:hypothetical protein
MGRLITCGWEENDLLATGWASVAGTAPTIVTSGPTPHSGTYCLLTSAVSGASNVRRIITSKTSGSLFPRFYWQSPVALPVANTVVFTIANSGAGVAQTVQMLTTGALQLSNSVASTTNNTATGLAANTWYRIEVDLVLHATAGAVTLRAYVGDATGMPAFTASLVSQNTLSTNAQQFWLGRTTSTAQFAYDDFAVNDETGTVQNGTPGPEKYALMRPSSDVTVNWTKAGSVPASTNWDGVNDVPGTPDDATTYNENSATATDRFGLTALPVEVPVNAVITLVEVVGRMSAGAASQQLQLNGWDDTGAGFASSGIALGNGTWAASTETQRALLTATAGKTPAQINAFNAGYSGSVGVGAKRVSALWVTVGWIDAPALPPPALIVNTAAMRAASW